MTNDRMLVFKAESASANGCWINIISCTGERDNIEPGGRTPEAVLCLCAENAFKYGGARIFCAAIPVTQERVTGFLAAWDPPSWMSLDPKKLPRFHRKATPLCLIPSRRHLREPLALAKRILILEGSIIYVQMTILCHEIYVLDHSEICVSRVAC